MPYKYKDIPLWDGRMMLIAKDKEYSNLIKEHEEKLKDISVGDYFQIAFNNCWLIADYTKPETIVTAFLKWIADHPNVTTIPMSSNDIYRGGRMPPIDLVDLIVPHIPSHLKVIFYN